MAQLSLFDYIEKENTKNIPILFTKGNILYFVRRADVEKCTVCEEKSWFVHNNTSRGYRIIFENGYYGVITNESLSQEVFFSEVDAIKAAEEYANSCDMLRADQMHLQVLESYEYIRGCDGYVLRSYLADMGNGYLYVKDFMTYAHVVKDTPKAREAYRKGIIENQKYNKVSKSAFHPKGVNMYRCKNDGEWLYAEARYTH